MRSFRLLLTPLVLAPLACESDLPPTEEPGESVFTIGAVRPATLMRPVEYVPGTPIPVVIVLHGYNSHSGAINRYLGIGRRINEEHFAVILPEGTKNPNGQRFWNATDYCCDFWNTGPDDVGYLNSLYEEAGNYVTTSGVYLIGHSNGGFMAYRMACESMPELKGIVSLAGTTYYDPDRCEGAAPVPVLHLHGTSDGTIQYGGWYRTTGAGRIHYPGAAQTVERWAGRAGCDVDAAAELESIELVLNIPDAETHPTRYEAGCEGGIALELWTIEDGSHVPGFNAVDIGRRLIHWLFYK